jgi:hypothetical protein
MIHTNSVKKWNSEKNTNGLKKKPNRMESNGIWMDAHLHNKELAEELGLLSTRGL